MPDEGDGPSKVNLTSSRSFVESSVPSSGLVASDISTGAVRLLHEFTGRGAVKARTVINDDMVVILMAEILLKAERSLIEDGKHDLVLDLRREFQDTMRDALVGLVEDKTGRKVVAFMSANHLEPDLAAEIFMLAPQGAG
jgi:uncharacterized protein YbcI